MQTNIYINNQTFQKCIKSLIFVKAKQNKIYCIQKNGTIVESHHFTVWIQVTILIIFFIDIHLKREISFVILSSL